MQFNTKQYCIFIGWCVVNYLELEVFGHSLLAFVAVDANEEELDVLLEEASEYPCDLGGCWGTENLDTRHWLARDDGAMHYSSWFQVHRGEVVEWVRGFNMADGRQNICLALFLFF